MKKLILAAALLLLVLAAAVLIRKLGKNRRSWRTLCRAAVFVAFGILLFAAAQELLSPDWRYPHWNNPHADRMEEFYELADTDTDIQVLLLGSSHMEYGAIPMQIYEASGITVYNLSSDGQTLDTSYYLLREALRDIHPKYVFVDAVALFNNTFKSSIHRYMLDGMRLGESKLAYALDYTSHFQSSEQSWAFISVFLPFFEYHERWSELNKNDFAKKLERNFYTKGEYIRSESIGGVDIDLMNSVAETNHSNEGWVSKIDGGETKRYTIFGSAYDPKVAKGAEAHFRKIQELCRENGIQLVLIKVPDTQMPQANPSSWTSLRSETVKAYAEQAGVTFIDLLYDVDIGIDWMKDSIDGGLHLNFFGAEKVSAWLADYLQNVCGLSGSVCAPYEEDLPLYSAVRELVRFHGTTDLQAYLDKLLQMKDVSLLIAACDDMRSALPEEAIEKIHALGFQTDFNALAYSDSYIGIRDGAAVVCERASNRKLSLTGELSGGEEYSVSSCGWLLGAEAEIMIDGTDYAVNKRGINIVVYDSKSGAVLDSVAFDTFTVPATCSRRSGWDTEISLREYEQYLMAQAAK